MNVVKPLVSVIVPVYKVEKYIEECIDSILAQTYPNLEIILVDDGSPDNCGVICDQYAEKYPDKVRVVHKINGGLSSARNAGLEEATGEYVSFIDSDDMILPEMYSEMVDAMERYSVDIVASDFRPWDKGHKVATYKGKSFTGKSDTALSLALNWKVDRSAVTKLYKRSAIGNLRFHEGLTNEDFPFICELYLKRLPIHVMDKGYYLYRYNTGSISTLIKPSLFDNFTNLDYVSGIIPETERKIRRDFERYSLQIHIMTAKKIVLSRTNSVYKDWLRINRRYICQHLFQLIFDRNINYRWRLKAMIAFLKLPSKS